MFCPLLMKASGEGERRNGSTKNGPEVLPHGHRLRMAAISNGHDVAASGGADRWRNFDGLRFTAKSLFPFDSAPERRIHIEKSDCEERVIN